MKYAQIEWNKGTPRSARFDDVYFSADSGIEESRYVFLQQNELPQRWNESDSFVIAETGFGTGLNFLVTMQAWLQSAADDARLTYISIENRPVSPADLQRLAGRWPELDACVHELLQHYPPPLPGMHLLELGGGRIRLQLLFADVEEALEQFSNEVDAWYLDGFAPARNPQMWSARVFELIGRHTRVGGSFATYTAAGAVRRGLTDAGFVVQKAKGHGAKRDMLRGFIFEQRCYVVDKPWFKLPLTGFSQKHAVIVGAGLAGLATAWSLCRRGWDITLIDRHASVAAGASGNPAGLLMPRMTQDETLDARFYLNAYVHAQQCLDRLQAGSEQPFWFKTGNLLLGDTEKLQRLCQSHRFDDDFIRYVRSADSEAAAGVELEQDALLLVNAGWVNVRLLCEQLRFECGDRLRYLHADAAVIRRDHDNWHVSDQDDGCIASAKCVVLANAAAAGQLAGLDWLPLQAVRGQLTLLEQTPVSGRIQCGISGERYITPAFDGTHTVGASYNLDSTSAECSSGDHADNIHIINGLTQAGFEQAEQQPGRVAFRAVSRDRVPVVGCVPDSDSFARDYHDLQHGRSARHYPAGTYLPGLYVSTAHGSRGLASCFIAAEIIASMITAEPAPVEKDVLDYLNPARFLVRKLKRGRH